MQLRLRDRVRDSDTADRDRTLQQCSVSGSEALHTLTSIYKVHEGKLLSR